MPALSFWDVAAKRPSCLMAVTPYRGGTWASMLKPGVAMPSPVMRNFATESATWYDAYLAWAGLTDYEWTIKFTPHSSDNATIFGTGTSSGLRIYIYGGKLSTMFGLDYTTAPPNAVINEAATITVSYVNGVKTSIINGQTMTTIGATATPVPAPLTSSFGGTISEITLKNLTTGKTVWSYPTWAEEKRLLTFTNVRTDRGVFEAANASRKWGATTQLDLRGRPTRLTMIARCYIPPLLTSGTLDVYNLIAQGSAQSFTDAVCNFGIYVYQTELRLLGGFDAGSVSALQVSGSNADAEHVIACVIDYDARQSRMYLDGVMLEQRNNPAMPSTFPTSAVYTAVTLQNSTYDNKSGTYPLQIHHAQIYDYAMTAAEIAQFK